MSVVSAAAAQWQYQRKLSGLLGWRAGLHFRARMSAGGLLGLDVKDEIRVASPVLHHPVHLRIPTSDAEVFGQVIRHQEYRPVADATPGARVIVDCGANAGFTSAYLLSRFPEAQVIAIEPFAENAALCRRNLAPYGSRATVIEAAIWSHSCRLVVAHHAGNEWAVQVRTAREGEAGDVDGVDIPSLGLRAIDILKVDIEGAECEMFGEGAESWIPTARTIAIELHGPGCAAVFGAAMARVRAAGHAFRQFESGELTVCADIAAAY
jgi:FkbM family methyltransferase